MAEQYLKPLKAERKGLHAVFDIETNSASNKRAGFERFEMGGFFDGLVYRFCSTMDELLDVILCYRNKSKVIYAHNGGKFDFLYILEAINKRNIPCKLIVQGSRITGVTIRRSATCKITLCDSWAILPYSLEKLCEIFKPDDSKKTGAINFKRERVDKKNPLHREYLEYDCRSLYSIIAKYKNLPMLKGTKIGITRSSTGMAAWRRTLKESIRMTPDEVQRDVRKAYAGGRTEVFRMKVEGERDYKRGDIVSLYPRMMLNPLPVEWEGASGDADDFGFHDVLVEVPECHIPVLWNRTDRLLFPTGIFRGWFFSEELRYAETQGAKILRHYGGHRFSKSTDLFREYVEGLFKVRAQNPDVLLPDGTWEKHPFNVAAKDLLNHTYGKTAEREKKKKVLRVDLEDPDSWPDVFEPVVSSEVFRRYGLAQVEDSKRSPHMLAHIAAAVTAHGRIHMHRTVYSPFEKTLAYTDTDSGDFRGAVKSGEGLGELKIEYGEKERIEKAIYLAPKGYFLVLSDGRIIRRLKGFSGEFLKKVSPELFELKQFEQKQKKLGTWRRSLQENGKLISMIYDKKSIISEYSKRFVFPDGKTRPWHCRHGEFK